jgi:hypothetical protein
MISVDDARKIAEAFLDANVRDRFDHEVMIVDDAVEDIGVAWVFPYDGRAYIEAEDWREAMAGNTPLVVDKETMEVGFANP